MKIPVAIKILCLPPLFAVVAFWALSLYMVVRRIWQWPSWHVLAACAAAILGCALAFIVRRLRRVRSAAVPPACDKRDRTWPLAILYAVLLAVLTLSAASYMNMRNACLEARGLLAALPGTRGDMLADSLRLGRMHEIVLGLEARLAHPLLPDIRGDGRRILAMLKERFCAWYAADVLAPGDARLDKRLDAAIQRRNAADEAFIRVYAYHLLWRLNALETGGKPLDMNA
jgi:hypothetical protein